MTWERRDAEMATWGVKWSELEFLRSFGLRGFEQKGRPTGGTVGAMMAHRPSRILVHPKDLEWLKQEIAAVGLLWNEPASQPQADQPVSADVDTDCDLELGTAVVTLWSAGRNPLTGAPVTRDLLIVLY